MVQVQPRTLEGHREPVTLGLGVLVVDAVVVLLRIVVVPVTPAPVFCTGACAHWTVWVTMTSRSFVSLAPRGSVTVGVTL
jgi:hypothetical protein